MSMSQFQLADRGHSSNVQMHLSVNGHVLKIGQLAPNFVILQESIAHPPAQAEIFMSVDGHESRWQVFLVNGITPAESKTAIALPGS
jgi:hypothetical protein